MGQLWHLSYVLRFVSSFHRFEAGFDVSCDAWNLLRVLNWCLEGCKDPFIMTQSEVDHPVLELVWSSS